MKIKCNNLLSTYYIYLILMTINFFLTKNPYSAYHSGSIGNKSKIISKYFFISPAYLILLAALIVFFMNIRKENVYKVFVGKIYLLLLLIFLIISGIITNVIFFKVQTYMYDIVMIFLVVILAYSDVKNKKKFYNIDGIKKILKISIFVFILGIVLAFLKPNIYGILSIKYSRIYRGEITYWLVSGLPLIFPTLLLLSYEKTRYKILIVLYSVYVIIIFFTGARALLISSLIPFLVYFYIKNKNMRFLFLLLIPIIISMSKKYIFLDYGLDNLDKILNGRFDLWKYHFEAFLSSPILGNGAFLLERSQNYKGIAKSEIGILKWFSENGIVFGSFMVFLSLRAIKKVIIYSIKNYEKIKMMDKILFIIYLSIFLNILENYSRILKFDDFLFWYITFYLNIQNFNYLKRGKKNENSYSRNRVCRAIEWNTFITK